MEARISMKLFDFAKFPQKLGVIVRAGDFSKQHLGEHQLPQDLLAALMIFSNEDYQRCCKDCSVLLQKLNGNAEKFQQAEEHGQLALPIILAIAQLDLLHSFFHGGSVVAHIWQMRGLQIEVLFKGVSLESDFAQTIALLGRAGLTSELAYRAIVIGDRAENFRQQYSQKLAWLDVIEDPQPAN